MDEEFEIDLKKIIGKVLQNWHWIAAITILVGFGVGLYSYLQPRVYKAQAIIAITSPLYLPNFDPRYQTVNTSNWSNRAILDLARSDQVQISVFEEWQNPSKPLEDRQSFRTNALKASEGSDPRMIILSVAVDNPQEAARLSNFWAEQVVKQGTQLYSGPDETQALFFESQILTSLANLEAAEARLVEFEGRSEIEPLKSLYNDSLLMQREALRKQRVLSDAIRDAEGLLEQVSAFGREQAIPSWMSMNFTLLQIRVYGDVAASAGSPIQFQITDTISLQQVTAGEFRNIVQNWIQTALAHSLLLEEVQAQTSAAMIELQQRIQILEHEKQRLTLDHQLATDTYTIMNKKYAEVRITIDDTSGDLKVASYSVPPLSPESRDIVKNAGIASFLGFFFAVVLILVRSWWESNAMPAAEPSFEKIGS
jgi:capsular polysaccharide biosynthesis protein